VLQGLWVYIPYVEVWCKEPIATSLITACIVRCCVGGGLFSVLDEADRILERVEQMVQEYQQRYSDDFDKRASENEFWDEVYKRL